MADPKKPTASTSLPAPEPLAPAPPRPTASVNVLADVVVADAPKAAATKRYAAILLDRPITRYLGGVGPIAGVVFAKVTKVHTGRGPDELAVSRGAYAIVTAAELALLRERISTVGLRPSYDEKGKIQGCVEVDWGPAAPMRRPTQRLPEDVPLVRLVEFIELVDGQRLSVPDLSDEEPAAVDREPPEGVAMLDGTVREFSARRPVGAGSSLLDMAVPR